ncbi:hypothetical protein Nos7524_0695 [Nostoc sp. PCC 7524]|nr:hypothetical protein Nos7524_0695 [Nostoc sp. PCC 7524]
MQRLFYNMRVIFTLIREVDFTLVFPIPKLFISLYLHFDKLVHSSQQLHILIAKGGL